MRAAIGAVVAAVAVVGATRVGSGWLNGDAAVYAAQGWQGDVFGRDVHLAWTGLAVAVAPIAGPSLPVVLDIVTLGCAVGAVVAAGVIGRRVGFGLVAALGAAVAVWPWAPFSEVDVPWTAAVIAAVAVSSPRVAGGCVAVAIALSPTAVLAVPWVWVGRWWSFGREGVTLGVAAFATVLGLTALTGGGWWVGERGVWVGASAPTLPALWVCGAGFGVWLWGWGRWAVKDLVWVASALPLLFAPPDVPAGLVLGPTLGALLAAAWVRAPVPRWRLAAMVFGFGALAIRAEGEAAWRVREVTEASRTIAAVAAALGPDDSFIAPWTWGARVAVVATGDPYGRAWWAWPGFVRDQRAAFCSRRWARVAVFPPEQTRVAGERGAGGVVWVAGDDPAVACPWRAPGR